MRLSLCNEVIREMQFAAQCQFAAELGYDGLEVAPFTLAGDPREITGRIISETRRSLAGAGLVCSSLHWLLVVPEGLSITSEDTATRRLTVDIMRRVVEIAAELGADVLVHGSPNQRQLNARGEERARSCAVECFRMVAEDAESAGVTYCIEPLARAETNFINTLAEASEIVALVGSPALRSMIDCAASGLENEDVVELLDRHLPTELIAHVQVNDPNRRGPGEGNMRFGPIVSALKHHDYSGWVAVEPFIYMPNGAACAARSIGYIKGLLEGTA